MALELNISGNVQSAVNGIKQVESALTSFSSKIKAAATSANALPPAIENTAKALTKVAPASNAATNALINTGRVFQDLPFGIVGVANNINPLIESFQRLSVSAKAAGTTVGTQLLGALKGGGGLGVAISLITAALTFAAIGFSSFSRGASKSKEEADKAADSIKNLATEFSESAVRLTSIVGVITNVNTKHEEQTRALKTLNEEYGSYLKSLGIEEVTVNNVAEAYSKLIDNLLRQAVVKGLQKQISSEIEKTAEAILKLELAQEKTKPRALTSAEDIKKAKDATDKYNESLKNTPLLDKFIKPNTQALRDGVIATEKTREETLVASDAILTYDQRIEKLKDQLKSSLAPLLSLSTNLSDFGVKVNDSKEKIKKATDDLKSFIFKGFVELDIEPIIKEETLFDRFRNKLLEIQKFLKAQPNLEIKIPVKAQAVLDAKQTEADAKKDLEKLNEQLTKQVQNIATNLATAIGEGFGEAATGNIQGFFSGIFQVLGAGLKQLGVFVISISKLIQGLKVALNTLSPAAQLAVGLGLVALGTVIQKALPKFAEGGIATRPTLGIFGEKGPEVLMPLNRLRSIIGGGAGGDIVVTVDGVIRGNDLALLAARTSRSQTRTMGRG